MYYGNLYGAEETMVESSGSEAELLSQTAKQYSDRLVDQIMLAKNTPAVQQTLSDLGLQTYIKDVNKEMVKNLLTAYGAFAIAMALKNNLLKVGVAGLAIWLFTQNKDKMQMAINNIIPDDTPQVDTNLPITIDAQTIS